MGPGITRRDLQRLMQCFECLVEPARPPECFPKVRIGDFVLRIDPNRLTKCLNGLLILPPMIQQGAQVVIGTGVVRTLRDDVLPHADLTAVVFIAVTRNGTQRDHRHSRENHTGHPSQGTSGDRPSAEISQARVDTSDNRDNDGRQRQIHAMLKQRILQRNEAGRRGKNDEEPRAQKAEPRLAPERQDGSRQ